MSVLVSLAQALVWFWGLLAELLRLNRGLFALGLTTAAGSMGQVIGLPLAQYLLNWMHWSSVFLVFAGLILLCLFCLPFMRSQYVASKEELEESLGSIVSRAVRDPSYIMIFIGFFSCGFQLAFVTAHFPAFVTEVCASISPDGLLAKLGITTTAALGAVAIGVIGVFNIIGTIFAGALGNVYRKKYLLAGIYAGRTLIAAWFILVPMTPFTVLVFSVVMGSFMPRHRTVNIRTCCLSVWLALHGHALWSCVFLSPAGLLSRGLAWRRSACMTSLGLTQWCGGSAGTGLLSTIVHLPINERPRTGPVAAAA